jgi:hypothetical protein
VTVAADLWLKKFVAYSLEFTAENDGGRFYMQVNEELGLWLLYFYQVCRGLIENNFHSPFIYHDTMQNYNPIKIDRLHQLTSDNHKCMISVKHMQEAAVLLAKISPETAPMKIMISEVEYDIIKSRRCA